MKEATGELNMTVITLVAIAAIGAVFYFVVWPLVQRTLVTQTCRTTYGPDFQASKMEDADTAGTSQAKVYHWACCKTGTDGAIDTSNCHTVND